MMGITRKEKCIFLAKSFMEEDPEEYAGETLEEIVKQIEENCSDDFVDFTYNAYRSGLA